MKPSDKNNPFTTPETYFEEFSKNLKNRLNKEETYLPNDTGFNVPNDYFKKLHLNIPKKRSSSESKVIQLRANKSYYLVAASVAATLLIYFGIYKNSTEEISWDDVANTDIEYYFDTNGLALTSYEIAEVISVDELIPTDFLENKLQEEYLIDYLSENTDAIEELNLEEDE